MKAETQQILWHDKEPIFTCDATSEIMATAGTDSVIRVRYVLVVFAGFECGGYSGGEFGMLDRL